MKYLPTQRSYVTLKEAADYLSFHLDEYFAETDIIQHGIDGRLILSIWLSPAVAAKRIKPILNQADDITTCKEPKRCLVKIEGIFDLSTDIDTINELKSRLVDKVRGDTPKQHNIISERIFVNNGDSEGYALTREHDVNNSNILDIGALVIRHKNIKAHLAVLKREATNLQSAVGVGDVVEVEIIKAIDRQCDLSHPLPEEPSINKSGGGQGRRRREDIISIIIGKLIAGGVKPTPLPVWNALIQLCRDGHPFLLHVEIEEGDKGPRIAYRGADGKVLRQSQKGIENRLQRIKNPKPRLKNPR